MEAKLMFSMYGITAAMSAECPTISSGSKREWVVKKSANRKIIDAYHRQLPELCSVPALKTSLLGKDGLIKLRSAFQNTVKWLHKGLMCQLKVGEGIELHSGFRVLSPNVAVLQTKTGDLVWMIKGELETSNVKLHEKCTTIYQLMRGNEFNKPLHYDGIRFPLVSDGTVQTVEDMIGMQMVQRSRYKGSSESALLAVVDCTQECLFEMTITGARVKVKTTGARVKVKTEMSLVKGIDSQKRTAKRKFFVVEGPFTVFMTCDGLEEPYFVATFV